MASTPKYFSVQLPCKNYIRKYCETLYGFPVPTNQRTSLGYYVCACLEKYSYEERHYTDSFIHKHYTDNLVIKVSGWAWVNIGCDFKADKVVEINRYLESQFEEHMFQWVNVRHVEGKTERKKLIQEFAQAHGIELGYEKKEGDDISLGALVKTEYRMRKKVAKNLKKIEARMAAINSRSTKIFSAGVSC